MSDSVTTPKLPLSVRKDVRDNFESKKEELEQRLSGILGASWKIDMDPAQIHANVSDSEEYAKRAMGSLLTEYVRSSINELESFVGSFGEDGKAEINRACSAHSLTLHTDSDSYAYCGPGITSSGQLAILVRKGMVGTNVDECMNRPGLVKVLNKASVSAADPGGETMSFIARMSIKQDYDPAIVSTQEDLDKTLAKVMTLDPNFEAVYAKLRQSSDSPDDWESDLGRFVEGYFSGLAWWLRCRHFHCDDMLQEGFHEAVSSGRIVFRLVDQGDMKAAYNECVIEDGVLYLQTYPARFGVNLSDIADGLMDLL